MTVATNIGFALLSLAAMFVLARLVRGPSLADRVVATDLLLTLLVMGAAVLSAREGRGTYLEVMLVVAVVGFLGTSMVARFIERRGA
jgi:multisubunit Na+/H+ antiporter MnhF subunit